MTKVGGIGTLGRICQKCGKGFLIRTSRVKAGGGKFCSRPCANITTAKPKRVSKARVKGKSYYKPKTTPTLNKDGSVRAPFGTSPMYAYQRLHRWIREELGNPKLCEFCGTTTGRMEWSNISREYKKNLSDWQRLCKKCHIDYDRVPDKVRETMLSRYGTMNVHAAAEMRKTNKRNKNEKDRATPQPLGAGNPYQP